MNMLYQFEAAPDYNPEPHLGEIRALLWAINSADDEVEPAGAGPGGTGNRKGAAWPLHSDPNQRRDSRPWHALAGCRLEAVSGGTAAEDRGVASLPLRLAGEGPAPLLGSIQTAHPASAAGKHK